MRRVCEGGVANRAQRWLECVRLSRNKHSGCHCSLFPDDSAGSCGFASALNMLFGMRREACDTGMGFGAAGVGGAAPQWGGQRSCFVAVIGEPLGVRTQLGLRKLKILHSSTATQPVACPKSSTPKPLGSSITPAATAYIACTH